MTTDTQKIQLAIDGGKPVRENFLPYATQWIGEEERREVLSVLDSNWLTTGPKCTQFEKDIAAFVGAKYAVAVNSGTAALHCCVGALDIGPGDEVITTPLTFLATANCIVYCGATPVLVDIDPKTYNIDPDQIRKKITPRTKAIIPVHYGGNPCNMDEIQKIAQDYDIKIIEDAAHALSAKYKDQKIGSIGDLSIFSFHPVKNMTTAEGGIITTDNEELAKLCVMHRTHGITKEAMERYGKKADWMYDMQRLGHRYNMTEFQAALGIAQLKKLPLFQKRREVIVTRYNEAFSQFPEITVQTVHPDIQSAWHLYTIHVDETLLTVDRNQIIKALKAENIGVNVHYIPIHLHSYYQHNYGLKPGDFPITEKVYNGLITIPLFPKMDDNDVEDVITAVTKVITHYRKNVPNMHQKEQSFSIPTTSNIALGTAQFGYDYGINNVRGKIPKEEVFQILQYALDSGITVLDTAYGYQDSEGVIGEYIKNNPQSGLQVISKFHNEEIERHFTESLVRLNSSHVYGYLIHHFNKFLEHPEMWDELQKLKREGKIQKIGLSLYHPHEAEYILEHNINVDIIQLPFSIFDQRFSYLLPKLKERGIEIYVRSVFLQGLLFKNPDELTGEFVHVKDKVRQLQNLAKETNIPLSSFCINFAMLNKHIDKVILGIDGLANIQENVGSLQYSERIQNIYGILEGMKEDNEKVILPIHWPQK
ncbi:UDP-4-amino-4,6-dideoxy-N-acetyl-beta-L-altrosamine transaminase [Candidatus Woesearchaeota archaeon]|jgi:perosamine synthetase|nr:UDP-4-amino-4,6-dideoxy-N-acetyl-beta-L-altrosamine transaminase [Candidatus Woesearchaeota archaeon]MBT5397235.1 UDP-4-amino-4,6-dideoxy-N-acetyl-beta-L-altrosamine transaminase [Candidatus Woesearchaeota archaeon]MBT5924306.1 UDP-4-amino-4,6-dideoxy-N-acetyl-beta-L-altrosamine transaminase [Candidatus Woesearchaeota archaeon]MBT6367219.1 UDP-4-amino-4,6-dideoxy-N-acetyl-beta-L-altrosamine transaminase [Candidatus Woesearchaeota archaeon]MBT7762635.1 UDP-4-amino-4,6-dideoxy-N-acetyl-beta-L-